MKVYVVMQYRGTEQVGKGTPVDVYLTLADARDSAKWWDSERIGDECFAVEEYDVSKGS